MQIEFNSNNAKRRVRGWCLRLAQACLLTLHFLAVVSMQIDSIIVHVLVLLYKSKIKCCILKEVDKNTLAGRKPIFDFAPNARTEKQ